MWKKKCITIEKSLHLSNEKLPAMKYFSSWFISFLITGTLSLSAQNPFFDYGLKAEVLSFSGGKYQENFDADTVIQIGSVLFNTNTNKIVAFVIQDTTHSEATMQPEVISRWLSPDPLGNKFAYSSPYTYVNNNSVNLIDPDGRFAVSVHYRVTNIAFIRSGFSKEIADKIAHYSSVYADNPGKKVLTADNILHVTWNWYRKDVDYKPTTYSQAEENSIWHSMRSNSEADVWGMSAESAKSSGLAFGWYNIFSQEEELNYGKLGQGIHALEDAVAHNGAKTEDHLGVNWSSVKMMYNDMYGSTERAEVFANSAAVTFALLRKEKLRVTIGQKFTTEGMTTKQSEKVMKLLGDRGLSAVPVEGSTTDFTLQKVEKKGTK
jgi:hypothetical protein